MLADDELRQALSTRFPELRPDVEDELDRLMERAGARDRTRRVTYAMGLVAAAVVALLAVVGQDWLREARGPEPVDEPPVRAAVRLHSDGMYAEPEALAPGRYQAFFLGLSTVTVELDVPDGWGQDDIYALATGPGDAPDTRRIDLFDTIDKVQRDPCRERLTHVRPGALNLARVLADLARTRSSGPTPVTLGGHPGYLVRLEDPHHLVSPFCARTTALREYDMGGIRAEGLAGWTSDIWVVDVAGTTVVLSATHGPDVTPAQEAELVEIVQSASFVLP
jgi:hypothetical protein